MLKFLLIFGIILYLIYKIGSLFFRAGAASQQFRNPNGPIDHDVNRATKNKKTKANGKFNGGEYIDYEEIK
jgi:hypothetical protein